MTTLDECDMEGFGRPESNDNTITIILGDIWWTHTAKQDGDEISKISMYVLYGKGVII